MLPQIVLLPPLGHKEAIGTLGYPIASKLRTVPGNLGFIFLRQHVKLNCMTMEKVLYHPLVRKGTLRHLAAGTFAKCPAARHRHFFVTRSSDLHALPLQHVVGRWHRGMRCSWGSVILGAVLSRDFQDCLHAGQPLDISSSIYSCSAMVVISFLSILGNSFRMLRLVRPRSLVTWCSSVRVLILSDFITRSSRFSLCTSQLGWQGMTD